MSEAYTSADVLGYLARTATEPSLIYDFTTTGPIVEVFPRPSHLFGGPREGSTRDSSTRDIATVQRMLMRDRLHPNEQLLRVGWGWVGGKATVDGKERRVLAPLVSVPVTSSFFTGLASSISGVNDLASRFRADGDVLPSHLIRDPALARRVLTTIEWGGLGVAPGIDPRLWQRFPKLRGWLRDSSVAMGLPAEVVRPVTDLARELRARDDLAVTAVGAFYLSTDLDQSGRSGSLEGWAARVDDDEPSAFRSLYGPPSADSEPLDGPVDLALLPLDASQRRAVESARRAPVSVIVGPPGTGKSHTVAAVAVDAIERGERVLLASRSQHAASVLIDFIQEAGGPTPVVFGDNRSRADLAADLWERLSVDERGDHRTDDRFEQAREARRRRRRDLHQALEAESVLAGGDVVARILGEDPEGPDLDTARMLLAVVGDSGIGWWGRRRANKRLDSMFGPDRDALRQRIAVEDLEREGGVTVGPLVRDVIAVEAELRRLFARRVRRRIRGGLGGRERAAVMDLARALRAGRAKRRDILTAVDADTLLRAMPLWVGTIGDVEDLLPPSAGMFDLVIIDEASQVDQAAAPAALLRATRLVAVGDANQLRHTSFLSDDAMERALDASGLSDPRLRGLLDLRRNSLLDVAAGVGPATELSTHYRSNPHLIDFAARRFYDGRVQPATRHPARDGLDCIDLLRFDGERTEEGNRIEAVATVDAVRELIDGGFGGSIGIVSPLRAQADLLAGLLVDGFTAEEVERHDLAVGTVHAFQGAERDHMFISLAVDDDSPAGSFTFIENRNLFNVMVTRAKKHCTVITSLQHRRPGLIADYLEHGEQPSPPPQSIGEVGRWTREIEGFLLHQGIAVRSGYPVGHERVDLVVGEGSDAVALDCEVHPEGADAHIARRLLLDAMGWQVLDVFESRWRDRLGEFAIRLSAGDL